VLISVIGLIVIGFNYYVYGKQESTLFHEKSPFVGTKIKRFGHSSNFLLSVVHQVPILVGLIILDNNTVVNGEGKLIAHDGMIETAGDDVVKEKSLVPLAEKLLLK